MAIKLTSTRQSASHVKVLCYGDAGVGKTVLCATAPSPIIISAEAGLLSLADKDVPVIEVSSVEEVKDSYRFLTESEEAKNFETICLDSITEIAQVLLAQYKNEEKDPRQAYGRTIDDMGSLVRQFRDVKRKHIFFSAKMVRIEDDYTGIPTFKPMMPGKNLVADLPFYFDEIFALRIGDKEDGGTFRYIQTQADLQYIAKDRSGKLDNMERPDLSFIFNKILNGEMREKEGQVDSEQKLKAVEPEDQAKEA